MLRPRRGMKKQHAYLEKSPSRLLGFYFQASTARLLISMAQLIYLQTRKLMEFKIKKPSVLLPRYISYC